MDEALLEVLKGEARRDKRTPQLQAAWLLEQALREIVEKRREYAPRTDPDSQP